MSSQPLLPLHSEYSYIAGGGGGSKKIKQFHYQCFAPFSSSWALAWHHLAYYEEMLFFVKYVKERLLSLFMEWRFMLFSEDLHAQFLLFGEFSDASILLEWGMVYFFQGRFRFRPQCQCLGASLPHDPCMWPGGIPCSLPPESDCGDPGLWCYLGWRWASSSVEKMWGRQLFQVRAKMVVHMACFSGGWRLPWAKETAEEVCSSTKPSRGRTQFGFTVAFLLHEENWTRWGEGAVMRFPQEASWTSSLSPGLRVSQNNG